jgi:hypothetical protein
MGNTKFQNPVPFHATGIKRETIEYVCVCVCIHTVKVKVKLSLCFKWAPRHESVLNSGCIAPRILDLDTKGRWVVSFTPRPLHPQGKSPWYPLDRRLGDPYGRSGHGGEEKNSQPLPGLEHSVIQSVAQSYTTELFRLIHIRMTEVVIGAIVRKVFQNRLLIICGI